ncbi:isopenicillin N synthase family dioxygenase [Amphiplicatus metriothermophilus]|uniref:2-oxoglutarate-dependent ethylene/succinate-forming enzyme n=1 Tax=Amphiplicatus metriothermophilus TaxID=1519374 RepID=A0A239PPH1_9PROT|nr:2-oxoglutarate and iron-dependent oxygenase domain-containing protein [Amphiplicatus metriothermophilus]MBB5518678.1 isopenicillin N synthase-like dioxygenase [Amphiplicatus metriothermophilus]SNT72165.1 Isopenicillin N synthase [Amphiplicatus metriothermophilus]
MARKLTRVPELSLRTFTRGGPDERRAFIDALMEGFQYFGFIILKDHGIGRDLLQRAYGLAEAFFALPEAEKLRYMTGPDGQRGYTPFGREHAKDSRVADLKEFWHVGREFAPDSPLAKIYPPNVWPERPAGFRETFLALYGALEEAGFAMLEALAPSLGVPDDYFRRMATDGNSILRILHYPPVPPDADPAALRAAPHEDINLITILVAANGAGLELLDRDGNWLPVDTDPDNLIVDAGDMLARATNDVIPATTHRVVNPKGLNASRYSMPFFMHPHSGAVLECIESCRGAGAKYPPITADAFLKQRLKEIGLAG